MVRSPLVWLNEPDPITSVDSIRQEDPELSNIREFFGLWLAYDLGLDTPYTTSRIIEVACMASAPNGYGPPALKQFLLRWWELLSECRSLPQAGRAREDTPRGCRSATAMGEAQR